MPAAPTIVLTPFAMTSAASTTSIDGDRRVPTRSCPANAPATARTSIENARFARPKMIRRPKTFGP
jgi:hypothetical protein